MWMIFKLVGNEDRRIALNITTCQAMEPMTPKEHVEVLKVWDAKGDLFHVDATLDEVRECMEITHDNAMVDFDLWRKRNTKKPEMWYAVLSTLAKPDKEVIYYGESDEIHIGFSKGIIGAAEKKEVDYIHLYQRETDEFDNITHYVHYKTLTRVGAFKDND